MVKPIKNTPGNLAPCACSAFGGLVSLFAFPYHRIWALSVSLGLERKAVLLERCQDTRLYVLCVLHVGCMQGEKKKG